MRWLGWSKGQGLKLEQGMVGGVKSQGRVSNNSSVSEARTHWPLALLLQAETFLFTADFNSLWTPALEWPCSGGKIDILYCYLKTLKSFSLTGAVLCSKLSCSSVWSSTFYILKGHLLCVTPFQRFCPDSLPEYFTWNVRLDQTHHCNDAADVWLSSTDVLLSSINLLRRRQIIQEVCFQQFLYKRRELLDYTAFTVYLWTLVHVLFMEATFCHRIKNE